MKKYKKLVIGIDESYARTGISIAADGVLLVVKSMELERLENNTVKRAALARRLDKIITTNFTKAEEIIIICERIRTFSRGFISTNYIKSTGALIATIVDVAFNYNIPVYSVDTRSWKAQVVGTTKDGKQPAIKLVESLGFEVFQGLDKKGNKIYNDDAADSACIALYGFLPTENQKLMKEE